MAMDRIPLDMAFRTALLLAGNPKTAEASVMDGIGACEDLSHRGLLIDAVRSTIWRRTKSADNPDALELLPLNGAACLCCSRFRGTVLRRFFRTLLGFEPSSSV